MFKDVTKVDHLIDGRPTTADHCNIFIAGKHSKVGYYSFRQRSASGGRPKEDKLDIQNYAEFLTQLIKTRRSIRRYTEEAIPETTIRRLLETAMWAPSAHNRQPWRFAVLTKPADKERLARTMGARLRADRTADGDDPADIERDVARSQARLTGAPVLIVVCLSMADMDVYPDPERSRHEWLMAVQSTAMAAQNLLLLAHAEGLAACWLCAPLFVPDLVKQALDLPADWQPQGLITLGKAAVTREKAREDMESRVRFL